MAYDGRIFESTLESLVNVLTAVKSIDKVYTGGLSVGKVEIYHAGKPVAELLNEDGNWTIHYDSEEV